jgi:sigma-B regulation protein RsbU (phosphoserine phosphatase)
MTALPSQRIRCGTVWGGISTVNLDVQTSALAASVYSSASSGEHGGDICYFSVCGYDLFTRIALADLQGHGEGVTALRSWLYDSLQERLNSLDGAGVLADLNSRVYRPTFDAITTAAVIGFCVGEPNLYFSSAGHPPVYLKRRNERDWNPLAEAESTGAANLPLGVLPSVLYSQSEVPLFSGDRLFLYTDGVLECPDSADTPFGRERAEQVLTAEGGQPLPGAKASLLGALQNHARGPLAHDDVTFMFAELS